MHNLFNYGESGDWTPLSRIDYDVEPGTDAYYLNCREYVRRACEEYQREQGRPEMVEHVRNLWAHGAIDLYYLPSALRNFELQFCAAVTGSEPNRRLIDRLNEPVL